MTYNYSGYDLTFIQKDNCNDTSAHQYTYVYKFYSPVTKLHYVLRADYHQGDVFAVKFYCKQHKRSDYKYSKITNRGDLGNIIVTCIKVVPLLLNIHPKASFAFLGARSIDKAKRVEGYEETQRFMIYKDVASKKIGHETFEHIEYPQVSGYMLINRSSTNNTVNKSRTLQIMFAQTYNNLPNP